MQAVHPVDKYQVTARLNGKVYRRRTSGRCEQVGQTARRRVIRAWVEEYKAARQCVRRGVSDFRVLDIHHPKGEEKRINVGDSVRVGLGVEETKAEVARCDVICANCYRIKHYWYLDLARNPTRNGQGTVETGVEFGRETRKL